MFSKRFALVFVALLMTACGPSGSGPRAGGAAGDTRDMAIAPAPTPPDLANPIMCQEGHYVGTYEGNVLVSGIVPLPTNGSVDLVLGHTGVTEFLTIQQGKLMGMASGNPYSADLEGSLNCATLKLEMGILKNGTVTVQGLTYGFEGPLLADFDPKTQTFVNGTWDVKQISGPMATAPSTGKGTWKATYTP